DFRRVDAGEDLRVLHGGRLGLLAGTADLILLPEQPTEITRRGDRADRHRGDGTGQDTSAPRPVSGLRSRVPGCAVLGLLVLGSAVLGAVRLLLRGGVLLAVGLLVVEISVRRDRQFRLLTTVSVVE